MSTDQRPLSPFMLGIYYRAQLTSVLSFLHRATGVVLSLVTIPLIILWLAGVAGGESRYDVVLSIFASLPAKLLVLASLFSLSFHLCNGIRHLFWDAGLGLELKSAYASGWLVVVASVIATVVLTLVLTGAVP